MPEHADWFCPSASQGLCLILLFGNSQKPSITHRAGSRPVWFPLGRARAPRGLFSQVLIWKLLCDSIQELSAPLCCLLGLPTSTHPCCSSPSCNCALEKDEYYLSRDEDIKKKCLLNQCSMEDWALGMGLLWMQGAHKQRFPSLLFTDDSRGPRSV